MKRRVCERDPSHIEEQEYTIEGHDHVYGDWVVTTPATCEEEGVMTRYCNICLEPDPQTQTIPAHGHDYKLTAMTPATCTEDGSKTYTCSHDAGLVSTYNFRTTVTKDLVIDICLDNSWIDNLPNVSVVSTEPNRASFAPRTLMKAGSSLRASRNGAAVLTQEQLATLLASYKTPEQVW